MVKSRRHRSRKRSRSRKRRGGRILSKDEVSAIKTAQDQTHKEAAKAMGEIAKAQAKIRGANIKAMTDVFDKKRTRAKGKLAAEAAAAAARAGNTLKKVEKKAKKVSVLCRNATFAKENPTKCASGGKRKRRTKRRRKRRKSKKTRRRKRKTKRRRKSKKRRSRKRRR